MRTSGPHRWSKRPYISAADVDTIVEAQSRAAEEDRAGELMSEQAAAEDVGLDPLTLRRYAGEASPLMGRSQTAPRRPPSRAVAPFTRAGTRKAR